MSNIQTASNSSDIKVKIIVGDIIEYVDPRAMMDISGLFHRKFVNSAKEIKTDLTLEFGDIKYHGKLLSEFFKICQGQSADIKLSDIYYLLLIAEEWESPEISQQLSLFLESKADPIDLLSRFSKQPDVFSFLIDIIASKFRFFFENSELKEKIKDLDPKYICAIIQNPNCELPRRDYFDAFIIDVIEKHKERCSSLIKYIDLLNTDLNNLKVLEALLADIKISPMFPNVSRILQLRKYETEYLLLKSQNKQLIEENKNLKNEVQLLESMYDNK